ncbi:sensor histidine kinase [Cohnella sp. AR92]|nr:sensor histidine kinase [Cohnella sp. AR92]RUS45618.1 sensor histidine kinase [Cohnella sp. AR92]
MKVKQQLILLFVILVSPVFILNWYANVKTEQILKRHVTNAYAELNKQNHLLINRDIDTVHRVMTTIIQNPQVQQMQASQEDELTRVKLYETTDKLISTFTMGISGGIANYYYLFVYDPLNQYNFAPVSSSKYKSGGVFFYSDMSKPSWADEAISRRGRGYLKIIDGIGSGSDKKTLAYIRAVNSVTSGRAIVGVLVATNMDKRIEQSLRTVSLPDNGELFLTDSNNIVLASTTGIPLGETLTLPAQLGATPDSEGIVDAIEEGFIYVVHSSSEINQKLVYRISTSALLKQQSEVKRAIQWISIAYSLFAIVVMAYFWRSLLTPLQRLAGFVRSYEPGKKVPVQEREERNDEVGVLIHSVHSLAHRLNTLIEEQYVMDIKQKEAQLRLLYQQINPHLLYNTLESIYWKSTLEGNSDSAEMIKELSKLMRISLSRGRELITIQEEVEHAMAYTNLQSKRYEYEFRVGWNVDPAIAGSLIPKITIQPLIENAILHGVRNMGEDGLLQVNARQEGDRVLIEVIDNGYQKVDYDWLNRIIRESRTESTTGYGIHNVFERIQLHYGSEYGISYSETPGGGTTATISLPYVRQD